MGRKLKPEESYIQCNAEYAKSVTGKDNWTTIAYKTGVSIATARKLIIEGKATPRTINGFLRGYKKLEYSTLVIRKKEDNKESLDAINAKSHEQIVEELLMKILDQVTIMNNLTKDASIDARHTHLIAREMLDLLK